MHYMHSYHLTEDIMKQMSIKEYDLKTCKTYNLIYSINKTIVVVEICFDKLLIGNPMSVNLLSTKEYIV